MGKLWYFVAFRTGHHTAFSGYVLNWSYVKMFKCWTGHSYKKVKCWTGHKLISFVSYSICFFFLPNRPRTLNNSWYRKTPDLHHATTLSAPCHGMVQIEWHHHPTFTMPPPDLHHANARPAPCHRQTCTSNRMLEEEVLPEIQAVLGRRRWRECIWQQVPPTQRPTD